MCPYPAGDCFLRLPCVVTSGLRENERALKSCWRMSPNLLQARETSEEPSRNIMETDSSDSIRAMRFFRNWVNPVLGMFLFPFLEQIRFFAARNRPRKRCLLTHVKHFGNHQVTQMHWPGRTAADQATTCYGEQLATR